jgi:hypothetical protein
MGRAIKIILLILIYCLSFLYNGFIPKLEDREEQRVSNYQPDIKKRDVDITKLESYIGPELAPNQVPYFISY